MLYSVNILRNFQRRKCCKEITENSKTIVRPHEEVSISFELTSFGQHILNWRTVGDHKKHIVSRSSLPVVHFFHRCFFVKSRTSETPECAAFPILWLSAGTQVTHGGQVQRPREKVWSMAPVCWRYKEGLEVFAAVKQTYKRFLIKQLGIISTHRQLIHEGQWLLHLNVHSSYFRLW